MDKRDFYDTYTKKRLVRRSDFTSIGIGKKHYVGGLLSKNLVNDYYQSLNKHENTIKYYKLSHQEFNLEISKIREGYIKLDINTLHSKLDSCELEMKEVFEKQKVFINKMGDYNFFTFLENNREYIPIYAEYHALMEELDGRKSNHKIIAEQRKYMKEISKIR